MVASATAHQFADYMWDPHRGGENCQMPQFKKKQFCIPKMQILNFVCYCQILKYQNTPISKFGSQCLVLIFKKTNSIVTVKIWKKLPISAFGLSGNYICHNYILFYAYSSSDETGMQINALSGKCCLEWAPGGTPK